MNQMFSFIKYEHKYFIFIRYDKEEGIILNFKIVSMLLSQI